MEYSKMLFNVLNSANFVICASMSLIAPFFPTYAFEQGVSHTLVGIIMALHPFGGLVGSLQVGKFLNDTNRQHILKFSMIVQAICLLVFILTYLLESQFVITFLAMVSRITNGVAYAFFITGFYSYIPHLFPNECEQKLALAEAASALGYMLGPMIGSILYSLFGFIGPFITFALFSFYSSYVIDQQCFNDKKIEDSEKQQQYQLEQELIEINKQQNENNNNQPIIQLQQLQYTKVLQEYGVYINALMCVMITMSITINYPLMAEYFSIHYQIHEEKVGFYMGLPAMCYVLGTGLIVRISKPHKPTYMMIFQITNGVFLFFFGPDTTITGIDRSLGICCLSLIITGFAQAFPLPSMVEAMLEVHPQQEKECNTIASALFSASISLGEFSGPFIGGLLSNYFELDRIASITGICCLTVCIAYIPYYIKHKQK